MFQNKKILILGAARSGIACCKVLANLNNKIVLNDLKDEKDIKKEDIEELKKLNVTCCFGTHPDDLLDDSFDFLVKNPGIRNDHKYVKLASKLGIPVINEVEVGYHLLPKNINLIAITGTNGKTTTTTLTYEILKEAYQDKVHLAGNIGYPLCSILPTLKEGDILVMEVSCQQLANLHEFKPHIALLTNLSEAHIDFFGDYETYKKVKVKLFKNQNGSDVAILNQDNLDSLESTKNIKSKKLVDAIRETSKHRGTFNIINDRNVVEDVINSIQNDNFLKEQWNKYQLSYEYAKDIKYEQLIDSIIAIKEIYLTLS